MTPFTIYLWQLADGLRSLFGVAAIIFGGFAGFVLFLSFLEKDEDSAKIGLVALLAALISGACTTLIPSSKTIAMMVAIPAIANSEPIQKDIPELYQLAKEALKEQIVGGKKTETK